MAQRHKEINRQWLDNYSDNLQAKGYPKSKWIAFCEELFEQGYTLKLWNSRCTVSKYITILRDNKRFKVRFSNHKPNRIKEQNDESDFFVGITHYGVTTTIDALVAVDKYFNKGE